MCQYGIRVESVKHPLIYNANHDVMQTTSQEQECASLSHDYCSFYAIKSHVIIDFIWHENCLKFGAGFHGFKNNFSDSG